MSLRRKAWGVIWRLLVCSVLMLWILSSIFMNEGRASHEQRGGDWNTLGRADRWSTAWREGPPGLWRSLTTVDRGAWVVSLAFMGSTIALGVVRWRMVLAVQGIHLSLSRALEISLVAHFFNSFLLGSTGGDLMKAYYAAREAHQKKAEAVVTVVIDRLIGLFSMLLFATIMMVPNLPLIRAQPRLALISLVILGMMLACGCVVALAFWGGVSRRWPGLRQTLHRLPKAEVLERSLAACRSFGRHRGFLRRTITVSMVLNAACVLQVLSLARGLDLPVTGLALFAIVPIVICLSAMPITPSGLGLRENLYVLLLASPPIGIHATQALSISLLAYAGSLLWSLLGGAVYVTFRHTHHLQEVARHEEPPSAA